MWNHGIIPPNQKKVGWGTVYNRVGVVKRHFQRPQGFDFPFVEGFDFGVAFAFAFCSCHQGPLTESCGGTTGSTNHLFDRLLPTMIRCSDSPTFLGEARCPIRPTMSYWPTRVPLGLPCMRTSCA